MQIIDTIVFNNELDLLDLRLNVLDPVVDKFVIVEADKTFSGLDKPRVLSKNLARYVKFFDKMVYIDVNLQSLSAWARETEQRNAIRNGLEKIDIDARDYILMSDVDEIPNPDTLQKVLNEGEMAMADFPIVFSQKMYYGHLNSFCYTDPQWLGTIAVRKNLLDQYRFTFQQLRDLRGKVPQVNNGGWHFSWMGGSDKVIEKIQSYSHQEYNTAWHTDPHRVAGALNANLDVLGRPEFRYLLEEITVDNGYPQYLVDNIDKYAHLILN